MPTRDKLLPQLGERLFLTDGGIETTLIFHDGLELPYFAAFHLMREEAGREALVNYYERHIAVAKSAGMGFILESPTWRASRDWGHKLGYADDDVARVNRRSIGLMQDLRIVHETSMMPMVVSGCVGPRGDGYDPGEIMSEDEAEHYHAHQIGAFAAAGADMTSAITITNVPEAVGIVRASRAAGLPVAVSFTVETDGRLPTGEGLGDAIARVDDATRMAPAYYMINCAHPTHFETTLAVDAPWIKRLRGVRANASRMSHAELNDATELDAGDPVELGEQYGAFRRRQPQITVLGGCCGTDHRHIECISRSCDVR
ncbi:MAG: homocysteine S-methyltransferase family protein [Hyphomicrobiaceae bacterium]